MQENKKWSILDVILYESRNIKICITLKKNMSSRQNINNKASRLSLDNCS